MDVKEKWDLEKEVKALRLALSDCFDAMTRWGNEEDGIPEEALDAYLKAGKLLGKSVP